ALYGVKEVPGEKHSHIILTWASHLELKNYTADETAWCGLFMAYCASKSGKMVAKNPLWARNWLSWGVACEPELGAVLVFERGTGGHVGLYVGEDDACYRVLGGNQKNSVSIARLDKARLLGARCQYLIGKPENVRKIVLSPAGDISTNEA